MHWRTVSTKVTLPGSVRVSLIRKFHERILMSVRIVYKQPYELSIEYKKENRRSNVYDYYIKENFTFHVWVMISYRNAKPRMTIIVDPLIDD